MTDMTKRASDHPRSDEGDDRALMTWCDDVAQAGVPRGQPSADAKRAMVAQLCDLGLDAQTATSALEASGWSVELAANSLMS